MIQRPRRNRKNASTRAMVEETILCPADFIYPLFLIEGKKKAVEIHSMPGIFRYSEDLILKEIEICMKAGLNAFAPFPAIDDKKKNKTASESWNKNNIYLRAIRAIKKNFPEALIMSDVAMDPYSSDGHDGLVKNGKILNDETLGILAKMAIAQADAGVDFIGPSDMMDGRVGFLRNALDNNGYTETGIISYTAKYASGFYGPFRDALDSAPKFGDKKTYQMNPANSKEALLEAELDYSEGADMLMVKPALSYLDIIQSLSQNFPLPIAAYNVSGEYAMIKAAAKNKWIDGDRVRDEVLLSIKRAGAKVILSYFAKEFVLSRK